MASIASRRLAKELSGLKSGCPAGIKLLQADDLETWTLSIEVLGESLYKGEAFSLRFKFGPRYPIESPEVVFVVSEVYRAPVHPHVYTNGHICASILGNEWSPVLNVESVCMTLQSMLASCKKKELPEGNDRYVRTAPLSPKHARFVYEVYDYPATFRKSRLQITWSYYHLKIRYPLLPNWPLANLRRHRKPATVKFNLFLLGPQIKDVLVLAFCTRL